MQPHPHEGQVELPGVPSVTRLGPAVTARMPEPVLAAAAAVLQVRTVPEDPVVLETWAPVVAVDPQTQEHPMVLLQVPGVVDKVEQTAREREAVRPVAETDRMVVAVVDHPTVPLQDREAKMVFGRRLQAEQFMDLVAVVVVDPTREVVAVMRVVTEPQRVAVARRVELQPAG